MSSRLRRRSFAVVIIFIIIFLFFTFFADRMLGLLLLMNGGGKGIIWVPHSEISFRTPEFNFTAYINNLGFRDREFRFFKKNKCRVIAIGDSFTYGWGVDVNDSWPKVLERNLINSGFNIEIANLGCPGGSPVNYVCIAEKAIPILRPDIVIIGMLQGDDLAQMGRYKSQPAHITLKRIIKKIYPNFISFVRNWNVKKDIIPAEQITSEWKKHAKETIEGLEIPQKKRFDFLDSRVKSDFINGKLNPALLYLAMRYPDSYLEALDIDKPDVKRVIQDMSNCLSRIKNIADRYKANVLVVSIPHRMYISKYDLEKFRKIGFFINDRMLISDSPDRAIETASLKAGIPFFEVTDIFRKKGAKERFYFEMDSHFNSLGCKFYAECLVPVLKDLLKRHRSNKTGLIYASKGMRDE